jgi:hypothetical protein
MFGCREERSMTMTAQQPRVTSLAPQFLVDDLQRSMAYYRKLGFQFGEPWGGFYAIGTLDGFELHLKAAPKNAAERKHRRENEHLDAAAGVEGIEIFYPFSFAISHFRADPGSTHLTFPSHCQPLAP